MAEIQIGGKSQPGPLVYATLIQFKTNNLALQAVAVCKRAASEINGDPVGGYVSPVAVVACPDASFDELHAAVAGGQQVDLNMTYDDTHLVKPVVTFDWDFA